MAHDPIDELRLLMSALDMRLDTAAPIHALQQSRATFDPRRHIFPLMKLPAEIRYLIYEFTLQQTTDHAISPPFGAPRLVPAPVCTISYANNPSRIFYHLSLVRVKCPPIVGALALLHTNRKIRSESADEFMRLARAHVEILGNRAADLVHVVSGHLEIKNPRFSRLPLFKSVRERQIESYAEYDEARQDLIFALKVYCLVSFVKYEAMRAGCSAIAQTKLRQKAEDLLRSLPVGLPQITSSAP